VGKQIVMDATGDTEHKFNPADAVALADAEKRFTERRQSSFPFAGRTLFTAPASLRMLASQPREPAS
jgi:hypothetical protein